MATVPIIFPMRYTSVRNHNKGLSLISTKFIAINMQLNLISTKFIAINIIFEYKTQH